MVYESDFYTTRRPYSSSSSRPYVSSYNVTLRTIPHMPYVAHKRLVTIVHSPVRIYHAGTYLPIKIHSRVRPSIIAAELNRIRYLTRPSSKSYVEHYLNSRDYIDFDDEAKDIRAKTDNLLRRVHVFVPRPSISDYDETAPEKLRSDDYVRRIINAKNQRKDIEDLPWYSTPAKRDIGAGHLACIKYAGGRPQAKRRSYYTVGDLVPGDVKSDVRLMSYYIKNRKAAEDASPTVHFTVPIKASRQDAPAPTVTWAANIVQKKEIAEEPIAEQETHDEADSVAQREPEPSKPEQNEKSLKDHENNEGEDLEAEYDENGVRKEPERETLKKVQEYLDKKATEKKMEDERRAWEAAERKRIAEEKEIARLAELKLEMDKRRAEVQEQERLEAERQAIVAAAEAARQEAERLVEDEKMFNEAVAQALVDEQERMAKELEEEKEKKKQEDEDDKIVVSSANAGDVDELTVDRHCSEEHSLHDVSDQDNEARPYEVDHEEDTQIEEDEHEELEEIENPFDGPGSSAPVVDEPVEDTPRVKISAGGEQGFDWSEFEDESKVEQVCEEAQESKQVEENPVAGDHQVFEESEVESHAEEDAQVEELQVTEEAREEEKVEMEEEVKAEEDVYEQSVYEEEDEHNVEEEQKVEEEEERIEDEEQQRVEEHTEEQGVSKEESTEEEEEEDE